MFIDASNFFPLYRSHSVCILSIERSSKHSGISRLLVALAVCSRLQYYNGFILIIRCIFLLADKARASSAPAKKQFDKKLHATLVSEGVETPGKLGSTVSSFAIRVKTCGV